MDYKIEYTTAGGLQVSVNPVSDLKIDGEDYEACLPPPVDPPDPPDPPIDPPIEPPPNADIVFDTFDSDTWAYSPRDLDKNPNLVKPVTSDGKQWLQFVLIPEPPCVYTQGKKFFRCEIVQRGPQLKKGDRFKVLGSFVLPTGHKWGGGANDNFIVFQMHQDSGQGPPLAIYLRDDMSINVDLKSQKTNGEVIRKRYKVKNAYQYGRELFFEIIGHFHPTSGSLKVYFDRNLVVDKKNGWGFQRNQIKSKCGFYSPAPASQANKMIEDFKRDCKQWTLKYGRTTVERL